MRFSTNLGHHRQFVLHLVHKITNLHNFSVNHACNEKVMINYPDHTPGAGMFGLKICAKLKREWSRNFAARASVVSYISRENSMGGAKLAPPPQAR